MVDVGSSSDSDKLSHKLLSIAAGEAHTLALTGDGCVFSWGRGTFGRLGTGKEEDEVFPVQIEFNSLKKSRVYGEEWKGKRPKFVEIAAGAYHSLALEDDGSVWCWGYNTYGQLGLNMENSSVPCFLERFVELGSHDSLTEKSNTKEKTLLKARSIKAGGMMSLAIDNLGALWMWGNCPQQTRTSNGEFSLVSSFTPMPVWDFHGHVVVKVACGNEHVIALVSAEETFTGNNLICYSWGNNNRGQLGLGDTESRFRPELLETFDHKSVWAVYEVACGSFHTALLARKKSNGGVIGYTDPTGFEENGTMCWTFGLGENGQLGHGTTNSICLPEPVEQLPRDVFLISVDCGLFHTSVVSSTGDVWSWGMEKGLGLCPDASFAGTDTGDALSPLRIPCDEYYGPKFAGPVQVACGAAHTVLIANNGYKLWAWGRGRSGVLGRGNTLDSFAPCSVMWPPLNEDFQEELKTVDRKAGVEDRAPTFHKKEDRAPTFQKKEDRAPEKVMESSAIEELQLLRSKLTLMERYTAVLHGSIFGKPFEMDDMPPSLQESAFFDIAKEWENILESADNEHLIRMEMFYRKMLANVKDKLMKRRIQELINECLRSSKTKT